jgi:hypothetical protein
MVRHLASAQAVVVAAILAVTLVASASSTLDENQARKELMAARIRAVACSRVSGVRGAGKLRVSIGNAGQVTDIIMLSVPPGMDDKTDACVRAEFNKIRVMPFEGDTVDVTGGFVLQ